VTGLIDGSIIAFDDQTLDVLWQINVGSGINAPPMTYAVNGRQYIAVASGLCCVRPSGQVANTKSRVARTPEFRRNPNHDHEGDTVASRRIGAMSLPQGSSSAMPA
jgi:alcohol dehydrogenase (cytochrome c)